jgi:hypothetical protein
MPLIPKNTKIKDSDNSPYRNKILFRLVQATAWCKQPLGASSNPQKKAGSHLPFLTQTIKSPYRTIFISLIKFCAPAYLSMMNNT